MLSKLGAASILMSLIPLAGSSIGSAAGQTAGACELLSQAEIRHVLGTIPTGMDHAASFRNGTTSLCQGRIGAATLTVRISERSAQDSANEAAIARMTIAGGGKVNTVTEDGIRCTTILPAGAMATEYGYDSICAIEAGTDEVAVQAGTRQLSALVPVGKLRPLVTLAAKRLAAAR